MSIQADKTSDHTSAEPIHLTCLDLHRACCLTCKREVWHWTELVIADGRAGTLDLECLDGQELLSLHGCHFELSPEDHDPDWAWVRD